LRGRAGDAAPALSGGPLLLVLTGHGGDGFLKFHDKEELSYEDLAAALAAAGNVRRYSTLLVVVDTCQAASLAHALEAARVPRAVVISSSDVGENSYAVGADETLALAVSDSFSRDAAHTLQRASSPPSGRAWRHPDVRASRDDASLARLCKYPNEVPPSLASACEFVALKQESMRVEATLGWRDAFDTVHAAPALAARSACDHDGAGIPVSALAVSMRSRNSDSKVTAFALGFDGVAAANGSDDKSCGLGRDLPGATVVERLPLLRFFAALDSVAVI
jgi:hypothetical protein